MSKDNRRPWYRSSGYLGVIVAIVAIIVSIIIRLSNQSLPPDFGISVSPMQGSVQQGGVIQTKITVKDIHGYEHPVSLSVSEKPSDVVIAFIPLSEEPTTAYASTMTMNIGSNIPAGDYTITIKGIGADGKEHFCKYILTVMLKQVILTSTPSQTPPVEAYIIYNDIGIAGGDVWVWSGADWGMEPPLLIDGSYLTKHTPEGTKCFAVKSGSGNGNYVGWGVFLGIFKNHNLITSHSVDLSDYKNLQFWVKTPVDLKVEIQQDNPEGGKSFPCIISNYGWNNSLPDVWQKVTIPKSSFRNVDLTRIFCPFMITGNGSKITFYVDEVKWVP